MSTTDDDRVERMWALLVDHGAGAHRAGVVVSDLGRQRCPACRADAGLEMNEIARGLLGDFYQARGAGGMSVATTAREKRCPECKHPMMSGPLQVRNPRDPEGPKITAAWWCANCHHSIEERSAELDIPAGSVVRRNLAYHVMAGNGKRTLCGRWPTLDWDFDLPVSLADCPRCLGALRLGREPWKSAFLVRPHRR